MFSLFIEEVFPRMERRAASIKNEVVSRLLDMPSSNDEGLYDEGLYHLKEFTLKVPVDFQVLPTFLAEGIAENR
jgi:hypothetical protein